MIIKNRKMDSYQDRALFWVAKAAGMDETRYWMNSVLFLPEPLNSITAVATDGRRLHLAVFPETVKDHWDVVLDGEYGTKIDRRTANDLVLSASVGQPYVNWRRVVPENQPYRVNTDTFKGQPRHFLGQLLVAIQDAGHQIPRFEPDYIEDVAEMGVGRVSFETNSKAFKFHCLPNDPYQRMAVVMPAQRVMQ